MASINGRYRYCLFEDDIPKTAITISEYENIDENGRSDKHEFEHNKYVYYYDAKLDLDVLASKLTNDIYFVHFPKRLINNRIVHILNDLNRKVVFIDTLILRDMYEDMKIQKYVNSEEEEEYDD